MEYIPIYILLIRQLDRVMGGGCKLGGFKVYRIRPIRGRDLHKRTIAWGEKGWALFLKVFWVIIGGPGGLVLWCRLTQDNRLGGKELGSFP